MLWASGELNPAVGGIPVRPEMNPEVALQPRQVMGTFAAAWQPSPRPEQRHRRSLYALRLRGLRDPFLEVFNAPDAGPLVRGARGLDGDAAGVRAVQQRGVARSGAGVGQRLMEGAAKPQAASDAKEKLLERAFELAFGRSATRQEIDACLAHWETMTARHEIDPVRAA